MRIPERLVGAQQLTVDTTDDLGAVAVFFDFENIVLGVRDEFRVSTVIDALNERGDVMVRRAYADWGRYRRHQRQFLEQGVAMVFLPSYGINDKNRTDTAICVDAMEILFTRPHIDTFVIASGDSDFGVLAHRLRDHGKRVVGISAKSAASDILVKICHEFIFYESLVGQRIQGVSMEEAEERVKRAIQVCVDQHGPRFRASVIKDRMRKQDPTFSERNYGAASFTRFLRNFDHLVELLDGGMVQVPNAMATSVPQNRAPANDAAPSKPPVLAPEIEAEAAEHVRRAIALASPDGESVSLARLKDALGEVAPDFDEMALGFRTFTRFLKTFPQVVEVERDRNRVRAVTGGPQTQRPAPPARPAQEPRPQKPTAHKAEAEQPETAVAEVAERAPVEHAPAKARPEAPAKAQPESPAKAQPAADIDGPRQGRSRAQRRDARGSVKPKPPVAGGGDGGREEAPEAKGDARDDGAATAARDAQAAPQDSKAKGGGEAKADDAPKPSTRSRSRSKKATEEKSEAAPKAPKPASKPAAKAGDDKAKATRSRKKS